MNIKETPAFNIVKKYLGVESPEDLSILRYQDFDKKNSKQILVSFDDNGYISPIGKNSIFVDTKTGIHYWTASELHSFGCYIATNRLEEFMQANRRTPYPVKIPQKYIDRIQEFLDVSKYKKYNIHLNKGLIISGPAGTGKSKLLEYIYNNYSSRYVTNEELIRNQYDSFAVINTYGHIPCEYAIELYDDIDMSIFEEGSPHYNNILPKFDSGKVLTARIFATNQSIDNISKAFMRPGRISDILEVANPDREEREALFEDFPVNLVDETEGLSYAEIQYLKTCLIDSDFDVDVGIKKSEQRISVRSKTNKANKIVGFGNDYFNV